MADFSYESSHWQTYRWVAGVDEAGRGPLAGPVVAAAVVFPQSTPLPKELLGLNDSKKISAKKRALLFHKIKAHAQDYALGIVSPQIIDRINILQATYLAMWRAVSGLSHCESLLIDGRDTLKYWGGSQEAIIKGDSHSYSIAAASILAKELRDRIMENYDLSYPEYGFAKHKGYPTKAHRAQVLSSGLSPIHRESFCKKLMAVNP